MTDTDNDVEMQDNNGSGGNGSGAGAGEELDHEAIMQNKKINEEYKIWKKHAAMLYDVMYSEALKWPTLTTQWFPDVKTKDGQDTHRILIGTHTSDDKPNYLKICHFRVPHLDAPSSEEYNEESGEIGGYGADQKGKRAFSLEEYQAIDHPGEVNRARYMPQNPSLVATMTSTGTALIFDYTKHPLKPTGTVNAQIELVGHKQEGYGISWNPRKEGQIATASLDETVKVWDVSDFSKSDKKLKPTRSFTHHSAAVNDVEFHPIIPWLVASVSDDKTLQLLDLRESSNTKAAKVSQNAHNEDVRCVAFNPGAETIVATGSADTSIGIWDIRKIDVKIGALEHHTEPVTALKWHPTEMHILASASDDRRLNYWDLSRCGDEQTPEDSEDGPPELFFMHGGHTSRVSDFDFNKNDPWLTATAADDNILQLWKMADVLRDASKGTVPYEELER